MNNSGKRVTIIGTLVGTLIGVHALSGAVNWPGSIQGNTASVWHTDVNICPQLKDDPEIIKGWDELAARIKRIDTGKAQ